MKNDKKKLYLFTDGFPYGKGEKTFIIPEISELKNRFDLTIISRVNTNTFNDKDNITKLDNSIENIVVHEDNKICLIYYSFLSIFDKTWYEEVFRIFKLKKNIIGRILSSTLFYSKAKRYQNLIKKYNIFTNVENSIYYTFWNNHMTLALCFEKQKRKNMKIISRIHRYDLYNERLANKSGRQAYKWHMNKFENAIVFISEQGKEYYINNFNYNLENVNLFVSYLGIKDSFINDVNKTGNFKLVSCSNVISLKRINYIIEALSTLPCDVVIDWIHFGDGIEMNNILNLAKEKLDNKTNINYKFFGHINNKEIIEYYKNNYVNCFITTTSSEGLPVSIMEALMFCVPIIVTDVGGIKEQLNDNGILLKSNPTIGEIKNAILYMYNNRNNTYRKNSRRVYEKKFNVKNNIKKLIDIIENL